MQKKQNNNYDYDENDIDDKDKQVSLCYNFFFLYRTLKWNKYRILRSMGQLHIVSYMYFL